MLVSINAIRSIFVTARCVLLPGVIFAFGFDVGVLLTIMTSEIKVVSLQGEHFG